MDLARAQAVENATADRAAEDLAALSEDVDSLTASVETLDKSVMEASEERKAETLAFRRLVTSDSAAKDLLMRAKSRLSAFYSPANHPPASKSNRSKSEGAKSSGAVFTQLSSTFLRSRRKLSFGQPPETARVYVKKSESVMGLIAVIDLLANDLEKEMAEARAAENQAQADHEMMMTDFAEKRRQDAKALAEKSALQARMSSYRQSHMAAERHTAEERGAALQRGSKLHTECDLVLQYGDVRGEARASEIQALERARAVLSGMGFSLLQEARAATGLWERR